MRWLDLFVMRLRMLFGRGPAGSQLDDELVFHLERQIAENIAAGMSPDEARYAAMRAFGNPALVRDQARATWNWTWLESLLHDVRYSIRTLRRTPGFAAIAILVIALGIGANVALFTVVRNVLLKPLPYHDPDRLVSIYEHDTVGNHPDWSCVSAGRCGQHEGLAAGRTGPGGDGVFVAVAELQPLRRRRQAARADRCFMVLRKFFSNAWRPAASGT